MSRLVAVRRPTGEDGSVLVMALAFLSVFGLAVAALLTFADSAFRASGSLHTGVEQQYAADAAVDGAINAIRGNLAIGKAGVTSGCFSLPAGQVSASAVTVQCTGRPGSGVTTGGAGGGAVPSSSVLTLPTSAGEGVILSTGAAPFVTGNVLTNQTRDVPAGSSLTVQGSLTCRAATGTGTVTATSSDCPATTAPAAADPGYAAEITESPVVVAAPACPAGATVTLSPGKYTSAAELNALTGGACTGKTFHFTPGAYYFEFADLGTHEWLINDSTAEVVGGTLTASAFPGRCDLAFAGVQFVFGSDSRLAVTAGSLELCPPLSAGQRIAVYGVAASTPAVTAAPTVTASAAAGTGWTSAASAAAIDGVEASWLSACQKCESAPLTVSGFSTTAVPSNATVTSATLRVSSRVNSTAEAIWVVVTAGDGTTATYPLCASPCAAGPAQTVTAAQLATLLNSPARANGVSVDYVIRDKAGNPRVTAYVDGIALDLAYRVDGVTSTSGCSLGAPYNPATPAATCAVVRATGGAAAKVALKGTVYAPLAAVDLSLTGQANELTQRGIVARTLQLGVTPAAAYTGPLLSMPGSTDREVLLTASIGGVERLRADATFTDGLGYTPGATVMVTRWSVLP